MTARTYPDNEWARADGASAGWSQPAIDAVWERARHSFSAGMLVHQGRVIGEFGNVSQPMAATSIRKAFLNILIGQLIERHQLRLDATLIDLGIDEDSALTPAERSATVRNLLTSRSGIYAPAAYVVPGEQNRPPPRGTHRPGEAFVYWNWGFNALGGIVERVAGQSVFPLFRRRIARPLGFQDFDMQRDTRYELNPATRFPAYLFNVSTRDRARIGLLYLNQGCWRGRQIVSPQWVRDSIAPVTDQTDDFDYGYLWWSTEPPPGSGLTQRVFMARGFANQYIMGFPELDAVFVLAVDMEGGRQAGLRPPRRSDFMEVLSLLFRARPSRQSARLPFPGRTGNASRAE
jgi:CubicO group peptidase (beta-lactamase class C family)